jgi:hypothetical protein
MPQAGMQKSVAVGTAERGLSPSRIYSPGNFPAYLREVEHMQSVMQICMCKIMPISMLFRCCSAAS